MVGGGGTGRTLLSLSSSSSIFFSRRSLLSIAPTKRSSQTRVFLGFGRRTPLFSTATATATATATVAPSTEAAATESFRHSLLLDRLRSRHLKSSSSRTPQRTPTPKPSSVFSSSDGKERRRDSVAAAESFEELGLTEEVMGALKEMGIEKPTEIQSIGVPAALEGTSVVLGSHTGSGKTLAYMLPLVQSLRRDEEIFGMLMKPRRPRAVVLCPTRELSEQVFRVAKSISHHARFRCTMISGGGRLRPQEDSLNLPVDMVVGTPGRVLQHIEDGNLVYGDIKYLVLDEADTMFDRGFGPDIRKFLAPLKKRAEKPDDQGFQTVLVTATMTQAVQKLVDEEFQGIVHLRTSTLHKKIASARHDFIKLSGAENKLESLLQVLEPSLSKGNRVMVFCNTLNSSRAVDHFLSENNIYTVNYHGEVPAEERVENLKKFKSEEGDCPTLVCTDLAARGLDLDVDHVIMFDFPSNSIDYLHRTGRTARMGAKGKVTSLVAKKDVLLASRIEEAIRKNESLESLNAGNVRRDIVKPRSNDQKQKDSHISISRNQRTKSNVMVKSSKVGRKAAHSIAHKPVDNKTGKRSAPSKPRNFAQPEKSSASRPRRDSLKPVKSSASGPRRDSLKPVKSSASGPRRDSSKPVKSYASGLRNSSKDGKTKTSAGRSATSKLRVVGFRGRNSAKKDSFRAS